MKTLLRVTLLAAALTVTALTTAGVATTDGTCYTTCYADNISMRPGIVYIQWTTTQADCCGGVVIPPCPAGYHAGYSSYQPYLGTRQLCPPPA